MPPAEFLLAGYIGLGLSYEGLKDYPKAKDYFQKGIDLIERQRGALGGAERERFLEARVMGFPRLEPYHGMIRVLIHERGKYSPSGSLFYAERARSRTFLEMLASRALKGKSPENGRILGQDRGYQQDLLVLRKRLAVLEGLGSRAPRGELSRLKGELEQKQARYEGFLREVKLKNAELASLISVAPTPVEKIQALLDSDTTLLEYYATDQALYAWLVSREAVSVYEIALTEQELRRKVDQLLLPNISHRPRKAEPVITLAVGDESRQETSGQEREKNRQRFYQVAQELYRWLLGPVEKGIRTEKLILVPHGVLHKVPFATLTDGRQALIERHALSVLPAASLLEHLVKKRKPQKEKLLVLANPQTDYLPLGYAEVEGKAISALFPQSELYRREQATESLLKRRAADFNILHLATHGEFNERQPLQSGLLLARDGENDGQLQVHETFGMDLRQASLVTLSACETALSRVQGGDDLVGLSRGFLYAGTPSLLATLWKLEAHGCPPGQLQTAGRGKKEPMADNRTAEGRRLNRRVEIRTIGLRVAEVDRSGPPSPGLELLAEGQKLSGEGRYREAASAYEGALKRFQEGRSREGVRAALGNLYLVYLASGEGEKARAHLEEFQHQRMDRR